MAVESVQNTALCLFICRIHNIDVSFSDKTRRALVRLGMSAPEIRAYSALLRAAEPTAAELSQNASIPPSKIYEILGSLEEKGWIGSSDSRPTKYFAKSPGTGLEITRQNQKAEFEHDRTTILNELNPIYEKGDSTEKPDILVLSGPAIEAKMLEVAELCRSEVMIAIPEAGRMLIPQAMPRLRAMYDRGIRIRVLAPAGTDELVLRHLSRVSTTVRVKEDLFGGGIIADGRYVMILLGPERADAEAADTAAIWADHVGLARLATTYFEYLFEGSRII